MSRGNSGMLTRVKGFRIWGVWLNQMSADVRKLSKHPHKKKRTAHVAISLPSGMNFTAAFEETSLPKFHHHFASSPRPVPMVSLFSQLN